MKQTIKFDGYNLHLIPTNKFKNVTISLKLASPLKEKLLLFVLYLVLC